MKKAMLLLGALALATSAFALPSYDYFSSYGPSGTQLGGNTNAFGESWVPYTNGPATLDGINVSITNYFSGHHDTMAATLPANFPGPFVAGLDTSAYSVWVPTNVSVASAEVGVGACLGFSSDLAGNAGQTVYASFFLDIPQVDPTTTDILFTGNSSTYYSWYAGFLPLSQLPTVSGSNQNNPTVFERLNLRASSNNANTQTYGVGVGDANISGTGVNDLAMTPLTMSTQHIYFVVVAYEWATNGTVGNDAERVWVDPASASFGANAEPAYTSARAASGGGYNLPDAAGFFLVTGAPVINKGQTTAGLMFNSLRIGTNWAYVTGGAQFTSEPASTTNGLGGTAVFSGVAAAAGVTVSYQWQTNGVNVTNGGRFSGATNSILTISNLQSSDALPAYTLLAKTPVNNSSQTSSVASLTLQDPWVIAQSGSVTLPPGSNAIFSVTAGGSGGYTYQWYLGATPLTNNTSPNGGGTVTGVTTSSLTVSDIAAADNGSVFDCIVTDGNGTAQSTNVTLNIAFSAVTTQPQSQTNNYGSTASFTVGALGTGPLFYQWTFDGTPLTNGAAPNDPGATVSGATTINLQISHVSYLDAGSYAVVVTNETDQSATSSNAVLTVIDPYITAAPGNLTRTNGAAQSATFTVGASGSPTLAYSWIFEGNVLTNGPAPLDPSATVSGAGSANLTIANVSYLDAGSYSATVTGGSGQNAVSSAGVLTVVVPVTITNPPASQTDLIGNEAVFAVGVFASPAPAYQWQFDGTNISGATNSTYIIASVQATNAGTYAVQVTNSISSNSASATLTTATNFSARDNLVGWWKFDDGSNLLALDSSGYGNNGNLQGFPNDNSEWVSGIFGDALDFSNTANVVVVPDNPVLNFTNNLEFSLAAWINPSVSDLGQVDGAGIIAKGGNDAPEYVFDIYRLNNSFDFGLRLLIFDANDNFYELLSGAIPAQNVWSHVVCTYNGNTGIMSMYTNGVVVPGVGSHADTYIGTVTNAPASLLNSTHALSIGCAAGSSAGPYNEPFQGIIDDVRIYDFALSSNDVESIYLAGAVANPPQITSVSATAIGSGQFQLNFNGPNGYPYRIWSSTNVTLAPVQSTWTLTGSGMFSGTPAQFTDFSATKTSEFYAITVP